MTAVTTTLKEALLKAGLTPTTARKPNPRCICCNLPLARCGWRRPQGGAA